MSRSLKNIIYTSIVTEITKLHDGKKSLMTIDRLQFPVKLDGVLLLLF